MVLTEKGERNDNANQNCLHSVARYSFIFRYKVGSTALKTAFKGERWMQALGAMNDKGLYILRIRTQ